MNNGDKKIIIAAIVLFFLSSIYISYKGFWQLDSSFGKNWWSLEFVNPQSSDESFVIKNQTNKNNFHWQILENGNITKQGDATVSNGSSWTSDTQLSNTEGKITVRVSVGTDTKEIYKK